MAVLVGSVTAAVLAGGFLRLRSRHYAAVAARDAVDADGDGIPDTYQR